MPRRRAARGFWARRRPCASRPQTSCAKIPGSRPLGRPQVGAAAHCWHRCASALPPSPPPCPCVHPVRSSVRSPVRMAAPAACPRPGPCSQGTARQARARAGAAQLRASRGPVKKNTGQATRQAPSRIFSGCVVRTWAPPMRLRRVPSPSHKRSPSRTASRWAGHGAYRAIAARASSYGRNHENGSCSLMQRERPRTGDKRPLP